MNPLAQLEDLARRVDALEQRPDVDQLVPGVFSLNAAGELEELLSGKLNAQGIVFESGSGSQHEIQWVKAGVVQESIQAFTVKVFPATTTAIVARVAAEALEAAIEAKVVHNSVAKTTIASISASAGALAVTLLDSEGRTSIFNLALGEIAAAEAANNSLFVNSATGKLCFKDKAGVVHEIV